MQTLSEKQLKQKRAGAVAQVAEGLPSNCEAMNDFKPQYCQISLNGVL
jgi:hypothetical protein